MRFAEFIIRAPVLTFGPVVIVTAYREIATACGLAMTVEVVGWSFFFSWSVIKHGRDVEDAVPYDFGNCTIANIGAGLPDGPPKIADFRNSAPTGRRDVEGAVPYKFDRTFFRCRSASAGDS